jgi:hypothetical protein
MDAKQSVHFVVVGTVQHADVEPQALVDAVFPGPNAIGLPRLCTWNQH